MTSRQQLAGAFHPSRRLPGIAQRTPDCPCELAGIGVSADQIARFGIQELSDTPDVGGDYGQPCGSGFEQDVRQAVIARGIQQHRISPLPSQGLEGVVTPMKPDIRQASQLPLGFSPASRIDLAVDFEQVFGKRQGNLVEQVRPFLRRDTAGPKNRRACGRNRLCMVAGGKVEPMHELRRNAVPLVNLLEEGPVIRKQARQVHPGPWEELAGIAAANRIAVQVVAKDAGVNPLTLERQRLAMPLEQFPGQLRVDDVDTPGRTLQQKAQQYQAPVLLAEQIAQASELHHPNLRRKPVEPGRHHIPRDRYRHLHAHLGA